MVAVPDTTSDGAQMQMLGQQPFRHWQPFIESLELEETIAAKTKLVDEAKALAEAKA